MSRGGSCPALYCSATILLRGTVMIRLTALSLLLALAVPTAAAAADPPRPLKVDDQFALKTVSRPAHQPRRQVGGLHGDDERPRSKDVSDTDIYMVADRRRRGPPRDQQRQAGTFAALQPRRQVAGLPLGPRRVADAGLADEPRRRRGRQAHRLQGQRLRPGMVARQHPPRPRRLRRRPGRTGRRRRRGRRTPKTAKPIVIRRLQFKRDGEGYLNDLRSHVYVFDVAGEDEPPAHVGPVRRRRARVVARRAVDRVREQPHAARSRPHAEHGHLRRAGERRRSARRRELRARRVETRPSVPTASGSRIVTSGDPKDIWYGASHVAVVPAAGGAPRPLTDRLDRNVAQPRFAARRAQRVLPARGRRQPARRPRARRRRRARARRRGRARGVGATTSARRGELVGAREHDRASGRGRRWRATAS